MGISLAPESLPSNGLRGGEAYGTARNFDSRHARLCRGAGEATVLFLGRKSGSLVGLDPRSPATLVIGRRGHRSRQQSYRNSAVCSSIPDGGSSISSVANAAVVRAARFWISDLWA